MKNDNKVLACAGHPPLADYVADYAAWAAMQLAAPLELLHVLERHPERGEGDDRSGIIGIDATEALLSKLSSEDEIAARALREEGRLHLNRLRQRALAAGAPLVDVRQRYGELDETLAELETDASLVVMGRHGDLSEPGRRSPGADFERVVRASRKPILTVPSAFRQPQRVMIAFDGGIASRHGVDMAATSTLFRGTEIYLLMSGKPARGAARQLEWARKVFETAGITVHAALEHGPAQHVIAKAIDANAIDLLVMGGYSHSPLRSFILGSKTTELLQSFAIPALLIR